MKAATATMKMSTSRLSSRPSSMFHIWDRTLIPTPLYLYPQQLADPKRTDKGQHNRNLNKPSAKRLMHQHRQVGRHGDRYRGEQHQRHQCQDPNRKASFGRERAHLAEEAEPSAHYFDDLLEDLGEITAGLT